MVLQPLAMMAVFSIFLARVGGIADKVPHYPLYVLAGLLPVGGSAEQMAASVKSDLPRFQALVKSIGIKPE